MFHQSTSLPIMFHQSTSLPIMFHQSTLHLGEKSASSLPHRLCSRGSSPSDVGLVRYSSRYCFEGPQLVAAHETEGGHIIPPYLSVTILLQPSLLSRAAHVKEGGQYSLPPSPIFILTQIFPISQVASSGFHFLRHRWLPAHERGGSLYCLLYARGNDPVPNASSSSSANLKFVVGPKSQKPFETYLIHSWASS